MVLGGAMAGNRRKNPESGKFEGYSPFHDVAILEFAKKTTDAMEHLQPIFARMANDPRQGMEVARAAHVISEVLKGLQKAISDDLTLPATVGKKAPLKAVKTSQKGGR
jgi:hypothetical protein